MDRYTVRPADPADLPVVVDLWWSFVRERAEVDRALRLKPGFDFPRFVDRLLGTPGTFCLLAEHRANGGDAPAPAGCLVWYLDVEPDDPASPFEPRRCGKVLGLYVDPSHRRSGCTSLLVDTALAHGESFGITDIDVLVAQEQAALHALIETKGLSRVAIQFTRHLGPLSPRAPLSGPSEGPPKPPGTAARLPDMERVLRLGHRFPS
jgi:GNAT superfamily N-acetyltransferase